MKENNKIQSNDISSFEEQRSGLRILMSGGGTGGHIFPAITIAQEIKKRLPNAEFLFIGAEGKMEMEKIPQAGFRIEGLNIAGLNRSDPLKNLGLPFKIVSSLLKARRIIKEFKPDFAVGTGGFASGPALFVASKMGVPIFIQEQNSLPGKTNIFLSKKAKAVFTAYPEMEKFFGGAPTYFMGNPIRENIITDRIGTALAKERLGLDKNKLTILSLGGSLGSKTLNNAWERHLEQIIKKDFQLIWQTGKNYNPGSRSSKGGSVVNFQIQNNQKVTSIGDILSLKEQAYSGSFSGVGANAILVTEFISNMSLACSAADVIVSRAGAIAISEFSVVQKPILLVPFPFAAEDHQIKNALTLVNKNAAKMVQDSEMQEKFWTILMEVCENETLRKEMSENLGYFAKPNATQEIVDMILEKVRLK